MADVVNVIPCMMHVDSNSNCWMGRDPAAGGAGQHKVLRMVSQSGEIPEDITFTEEYSVRVCVYTLFDIPKKICPVTPYSKAPQSPANAAGQCIVKKPGVRPSGTSPASACSINKSFMHPVREYDIRIRVILNLGEEKGNCMNLLFF